MALMIVEIQAVTSAKSLNEFRSFRLTNGFNLYNSLYEQDLSIFAHSDPETTNRPNSYKTNRATTQGYFWTCPA